MIIRRRASNLCAALVAVTVAGCSAHPAITLDPQPNGSTGSTGSTGASPATAASPSPPHRALPLGFPVPDAALPIPIAPEGPMVAAWTIDLDPAAVYEWFVQALPASGLPLDGLYPGGRGAVIHFRDGAGGKWELRIGGDQPTRVEVALRP